MSRSSVRRKRNSQTIYEDMKFICKHRCSYADGTLYLYTGNSMGKHYIHLDITAIILHPLTFIFKCVEIFVCNHRARMILTANTK